jgi:2-polyprenyl-3-methyl-5-hydroxy-6-metoxy-1,4-benzoquinol methylase
MIEWILPMEAVKHWDDIFSRGAADAYSRVEMPRPDDPVLRRALQHFGNVRGRTLIDLGCGRGSTSLFFASRGANVLSVDLSAVAIRNLASYCEHHQIPNIRALHLSALEMRSLGQVDFVFGSMILHHIEPFVQFANVLRGVLARDGKAFFWENNARSRLMIWCRKHIVGRLWIPKYGDQDEFPLTLHEVAELQRHFTVKVEYPELVLFRMISLYLLRGRCTPPFEWADRIGYRFRWLRPYSYKQYLCLS